MDPVEQAKAWAIYRESARGEESVNGPGSRAEATEGLRTWLQELLVRRRIKIMLDAPCGDWAWMRLVDLGKVRYHGWDVEPGNIDRALQRVAIGDCVGTPTVAFRVENLLTVTSVPIVGLILCRDFLAHLSNEAIGQVLHKFINSGSRYLITNNYRTLSNDYDCPPQGHPRAGSHPDPLPGYYYRPVNLEIPPFNLTGRREATPKHVYPGEEYADVCQEHVLFDLWWHRLERKRYLKGAA